MSVPLNNPEINLLRELADIRARLDLLESMEPIGASEGGNQKTATLFFDESEFTIGNWGAGYSTSGIQLYGYYLNQVVPADGDEVEIQFDLASGLYDLSILGVTAVNASILDWYIDDGLIISGQDWYSSPDTFNVVMVETNILITTDGLHTCRIVVNGKNASSADYFMSLTKAWFRPA